MNTKLTIKGQATIPKKIRDALQLLPGDTVAFDVNSSGEVVVHKATIRNKTRKRDRFDAARGKAQVQWRTDELMALLRGKN